MKQESFFQKYGVIFFYIFMLIVISFGALYYYHKITTFELLDNNISILKDSNYTINIISNYNVKNANDYIFTSSDIQVCNVDENGIVYAKSGGEATIDIVSKKNNYTKKLNVIVNDDNAYIIEFKSDDIELKENKSIVLKPIINNENNYNVDLSWSSSNSSIVTVDQSGKCKAIKSGIAYITVKIKNTDVSSKVRITVKSSKKQIVKDTTKKVKKVKVENEETYEEGFNEEVNEQIYVKNVNLKANKTKLKVNEKLQLSYEVVPNNATNKKVVFSSNNDSIASVNSNGLVTAKSPGNVDITITTDEGKITKFVNLIIEENIVNVSSISFNKKQTSLVQDGKEKLLYTISPDNASNKDVIWKSSNTNILTVDNNGNIKAIKAGTATVTVMTKDGNKTDNCIVTIKEKEIEVSEISLDKTTLELNIGENKSLKVTINPSNATNQNIIFESENNQIATINQNGVITGISPGTTSIIAKSKNNKIAKCSVTVKEILINKISLDTSNFQLSIGSDKKINYSIQPDNATDKIVTFKSSNSKVASIDNNGNIKGLSLGTTTITASNKKSGKKKSITVFVVPKDKIIDIRNSTYKSFQNNIATLEGKSYKHMQNFAISNINTNNQVIYLSTVQNGCINATKYPTLTDEQTGNLSRTIIYKITKNDINNPNRTKMYLENCGHGQAFDIEPNSDYIWTNYDAYIVESGGYYWGHSKEIMRIKFKETAKQGTIYPLINIRVKDNSGGEYNLPEPSIDEENNLILIRAGRNILIYNYSEFKKGNQVLLYKSKISSALPNKYSDDTSICYQGVTLKGGYIYILRGGPEKTAYIEAFNLLGESIYTKSLNSESGYSFSKHREPEGIHVYNNGIYIGSTHYRTETNKDILFDIGYLK